MVEEKERGKQAAWASCWNSQAEGKAMEEVGVRTQGHKGVTRELEGEHNGDHKKITRGSHWGSQGSHKSTREVTKAQGRHKGDHKE